MLDKLTLLLGCMVITFSAQKENKEKRPNSGSGEGRLFRTEPEFKVYKNNTVFLGLVVLLWSTNQRIQPGLMRGQECARRPPACVHNNGFLS